MRVISGKAKGRKLKRVPGDTTRPIMDRVKENLFNILGTFVPGSRWLDLFGGTGQVGIEALSRGAAHVVFVDNATPAVRTIADNLQHTGLAAQAAVIKRDAFQYLGDPQGAPFDLIYIAPPQYQALWLQVMRTLDAAAEKFLEPDGLAVVQIDPVEEDPSYHPANLSLIDRRKYGSTLLLFYEFPVSVT